jgi:signal transduction histidine kinase
VAQFPNQVESFLRGQQEPLSERERSQPLELYAQRLVERLENKIQELQAANQRLRELDRMKSDFIVLVSHELRTPLTLISGYTYLLKEKAEQSWQADYPQAIKQIAEGMSMGVDRLGQVVNEIISVSRITAGTLDLAISPVRLLQLVGLIVKDVRAVCEERGLELQLNGLEGLPIIQADGTQLKIAIENVVNNAIKFTPDGGRIAITGREVGDAVDLLIQDSGIGIPLDEQRRIFDHFHVLGSIQHHSTSKHAFQGGGIGLGLPIAKGIVEAHNGRIWVESERYDPHNPPGSTFHILLPVRQE